MAQVTEKNPTEITQSNIEADALSRIDDADTHKGLFIIKPGNRWLIEANAKPIPRSLFMDVWFENEVSILYAETNVGKSILATQIATEIAKTQPVVYFDFELSEKQFEARYSNQFRDHFRFPANFLRAEINPDEADYRSAGYNNLEDYINASIELIIQQAGAKVLIVDNITYLRSETEKARDALPLMKHLKALKNKYNVSILCLAHTPKRNLSQPITRNDLQGSKMLINFCDSAFALGESFRDKRLRYLKQIKSRSAEIIYDSDHVAVFEVSKPNNFLMFTHVHTSCEREHLKEHTKENRDELISKAIELSKAGNSQRYIANELGLAIGTVNKYLHEKVSVHVHDRL